MADLISMLAEARIHEWQRRVAAGEVPADQPPAELESWESQVFKDIVRLKREARALPQGPERSKKEAEAKKLWLHLMVTLERERPRLAQALDAQLSLAARADDPE